MRRTLAAGFAMALCACGAAGLTPNQPAAPATAAAAAVPPVKRILVLVDKAGLEVTLLELPEQRALIRVAGASGPLESLVLEHRWKSYARGIAYVTRLDGEPWLTLSVFDSPERGFDGVVSPAPDRPERMLTVDKARTAAVDVPELLRLHQVQTADGRLEQLRRFDRVRREQALQRELERRRASWTEKCRSTPRVVVDWKTFDDSMLMRGGRFLTDCGDIFMYVAGRCADSASPRAFFQQVDTVRFRYGDPVGLRAVGRVLELTVNKNKHGFDGRWLGQLRSTANKSLDELVILDRTEVCLADGGRVIISAPAHDPPNKHHPGVSYGDGKTFWNDRTAGHPHGANWFFDPRQSSSKNAPRQRFYSHVDADRTRHTCSLTCGDRVVDLKLADRSLVAPMVEKAVFQPPPHQRQPYALARDRAGTYYYVDRGRQQGGERDFRVFRGQRGQLRQQKMKDIVSDSEGEIFSTQNGKLRLVVGKAEAQWVAGRRAVRLLVLPVQENLGIIYNELGVYLGERLGVPCDDL